MTNFRVTKQHTDEVFEGSVKHIGDVYRRGNIHAEHGHKFALFNYCPDRKNGGTEGLPLGYYISRLHTSLGKGRKAKTNFLIQAADELFQMIGTAEKLPESVLDAMEDAVENTKKTKVKDFNMGENVDNHPFEKVRERYQNLFDDWVKAKGF